MTLSRTVSVRNIARFWKVRPMPSAGDAVLRRVRQRRPSNRMSPAWWAVQAAQAIEQRGLAGAVGADQAADVPAPRRSSRRRVRRCRRSAPDTAHAEQGLEERRSRARAEFQNLDTNRDGFVERGEAEALVHAEFNNYDTDRDNKITEPEVRLIIQRAMQREAAERQQAEARRRQGMMTLNEFMDMQLRQSDELDKNKDTKISGAEYIVLAGPADGPQAKNLLPFDMRKQIAMRKFAEIDTNKDGQIDRVELSAYALKQFGEMDLTSREIARLVDVLASALWRPCRV
jgi:Ca2+-binding EF-hand superfamily protein